MNKLQLGNLPTPIHPLPYLSQEYRKNLYIKRDDYTGSEYSGNKVRKLEYVLADALNKGCDAVITCGGIQSNHCRATSAACARLNIPCHVVLRGEKQDFEGNLFLDTMLGARVHLIAPEKDYESAMDEVAQELRRQGKKPHLIPVGASTHVGSLGYEDAWQEILTWEKSNGLVFDAVCIAVGSGGSYAGLWQGNEQSGGHKKVVGFAVSNDSAYFQQRITDILLEGGIKAKKEAILIQDGYVGEGYALATKEEIKQYMFIARREGIVLDPCYTGKAFRGMLAEMQNGVLKEQKNILFIHTGGLMGWTRKQREMVETLAREEESNR